MKKLIFILLYSFITFCAIGQPLPGGKSLETAAPICTDYQYDFPLQVDAQSEVNPYYDCLSTQPNPAWYYFRIDKAGQIQMDLHALEDVDFIIWGPYNDIITDNRMLTYEKVVDCSYSASQFEYPLISNAQIGEYYIMLITNYANEEQNFSLSQTSGAGRTDCSIVNTRCRINAGPDQIICAGETTQIQATATIENSTSTYTISWDLVETRIDDSTQTITAINPTQRYIATVLTDDGCMATDEVIIVGHTEPTPSGYELHYCENTFATPLHIPGNNVAWYSTQSGGSQIFPTPVPNTDNLGTILYYATTTTYGCVSERGEVTVSIHPVPFVTLSADDTDLCSLESAQLTASSTVGGGIANWGCSCLSSYSDYAAEFIGTTVGFKTITYSYVSAPNEGSCQSNIATVQMQVREIPLAPTVTHLYQYCKSNTIENIQVIGTNLKWYDAPIDGNILPQAPVINTNFVSNDTWYVTQSNGECESQRSEIVVTVFDVPTISFPSNDFDVCSELNLNIRSAVSNGNPGYRYSWTGTGVSKLNATDIYNPKFKSIETKDTVYDLTLRVIDTVGCSTDSSIAIQVYALPTVTITTNDSDNIICEDVDITLTANSATATSYKWKNNTQVLGTTPTLEINPDTSYTFQVIVADEHGCANYANQFVRDVKYPEISLKGPLGNCIGTQDRQYAIITNDSLTAIDWQISSGIIMYTKDETSELIKYMDFLNSGFDTIAITVSNIAQCIVQDTVIIRTVEYPKANFEIHNYANTNPVYFENLSTQANAEENDISEEIGMYYAWDFHLDPDSALVLDTTEHFDMIFHDFLYGFTPVTLYAINEYGCVDSIMKEVSMESFNSIYVPTAFAPNSEAFNVRHFYPVGMNLETCDIWVYDSWGNLLWHGNEIKDGLFVSKWDGTQNGIMLKSDTYIWRMEALFVDGQPWPGNKLPNGKYTKMGNVTLIR